VRPHVVHVVTAAITTRLMRGQLRYLREAGFEVTLVSSPGADLDSMAAEEGVGKAAVPMEREIAPLQDLRSLWSLWRLMRRLRPTVVNVGTAKAGLLAGIAARLARVPCRVYTLHGLRLETTRGLKRSVLASAERTACRCAQHVLCVSPSVRSRAVELDLVDRDRCSFLGAGSFNGVEVERFAPTPERLAQAAALRRQLRIPSDAPVIGFVGRFTRDKGLPELVAAFQAVRDRLPNVRLLLLGRFESGDPVPPEVRTFLETDPGVVHAGFVADPSIHYQVMDVLALPTYREGFPTVVLEAAAAEKPVVSTYATGARDAVIDGVTGMLVPIGDSKALGEALLAVLEDRSLAEGLGRAGRRRVEQHYMPEQVCGELAKLYRRLLSRNGLAETGREQTCEASWSIRHRRSALALKRSFDVCAALIGLAAAGPLMAAAAAAIRLTMGTPVLFRQRRAGRHGRAFRLLKFRTMTEARHPDGQLLPDAARLSPVGHLLRRFSVDELPQLWNVLKGDMSFVGPRPLLAEYLPGYTARERLRHAVRPGLTGYSQISGRHTLPFSKRLALDAWYVENWSIGLDLTILMRTIPKVLRPSDSVLCEDYPAIDDRGFWRYLRDPPRDCGCSVDAARGQGAG
jgi:lipopolysaccharide/colanic/teichoic acid biosynthesis glycosyltransferase